MTKKESRKKKAMSRANDLMARVQALTQEIDNAQIVRFRSISEFMGWVDNKMKDISILDASGVLGGMEKRVLVDKLQRLQMTMRAWSTARGRFVGLYGLGCNEDLSKPPSLPVETTFGEIIAWRVWRVRNVNVPTTQALNFLDPRRFNTPVQQWKTERRLVSSYKETTWEPGETLEAHDLKDVDFRHSNERTGIHAWKSVMEATEHGKSCASQVGVDFELLGIAIGKIRLWGDVVEHERGYRAQFAKVVSIDDFLGAGTEKLVYDIAKDKMVMVPDGLKWDGETLRDLQETYFPELKIERLKREGRVKK